MVETAKASRKTVLCVDDNVEVLQALRRQLRASLSGQARIEVATSAEMALARLSELSENEKSTVCIISDWLMPGMRGDEFVAKLAVEHGELPVVVLSGHLTLDAKQSLGAMAQVVTIIPKPWDESALMTSVIEGLERLDEGG